ncbi:hypothetical protein ATW55_01165 [Ferroacidibacillus organovorans]|uniref:Uncharacterized protein n=1 Tax=Ferroacidibacillus organovorans TaxID=1765683 RepID=A0A101XRZ7_9BACL|nr:hypothetical protein ATW55_01165 [Ferroacidibacillus organovorans]
MQKGDLPSSNRGFQTFSLHLKWHNLRNPFSFDHTQINRPRRRLVDLVQRPGQGLIIQYIGGYSQTKEQLNVLILVEIFDLIDRIMPAQDIDRQRLDPCVWEESATSESHLSKRLIVSLKSISRAIRLSNTVGPECKDSILVIHLNFSSVASAIGKCFVKVSKNSCKDEV